MINKAFEVSVGENDKSVDSFLEEWKKGLSRENQPLTPTEFFEFKDPKYQGSNLERIWAQYNAEEKQEYQNNYNNGNLPYIKAGTTVLLPIPKIVLELQRVSKQGQFMSQGDFKSYWSENYSKLIGSINYKPSDSETDPDSIVDSKVIPQTLKVWIYVKALDKIIDFSPFINSLNTVKNSSSGNFTINMVPTRSQDSAFGVNSSGYYEIYNITDNKKKQVKDFVEKYLTQNDIVFLRFEKLALEASASLKGEEDSLEISPSNLVNSDKNYNVWDMIGLIDIVQTSIDTSYDDYLVTVMGRDFTKLFVEDGSYFIPLKWVEGNKDLWFYVGDQSDEWYKRNIVTGTYDFFFNYGFRGIRETLWFIINLLSNIGIVSNDLFSAYKGRRTTSYEIETGDQSYKQTQKVNGIWQIVKVFCDDNLEKRTLVDPSFANPDGSLMDFIFKTCQDPFVEVLFDTYVDTLDIVVRQPPFTESAIKDVIVSETYIEIDSSNFISSSLSYDDRVYSSYRLFPQDQITGKDNTTSLAFVPIIYLNEITKYFGNKKLEIQDIYIAANALDGASGSSNLNSMAATMLNDLLFVIETTAYLPFTRRGTITINGDRRIKVGSFVKNNYTNELFYVTGVSNSLSFSENSISRETILEVERGMFFPILSGVVGEDEEINLNAGSQKASYFKIVDIKRIKEDILTAQNAAKSGQTKTSGLGVAPLNKEQFEYFLKRKMYK